MGPRGLRNPVVVGTSRFYVRVDGVNSTDLKFDGPLYVNYYGIDGELSCEYAYKLHALAKPETPGKFEVNGTVSLQAECEPTRQISPRASLDLRGHSNESLQIGGQVRTERHQRPTGLAKLGGVRLRNANVNSAMLRITF